MLLAWLSFYPGIKQYRRMNALKPKRNTDSGVKSGLKKPEMYPLRIMWLLNKLCKNFFLQGRNRFQCILALPHRGHIKLLVSKMRISGDWAEKLNVLTFIKESSNIISLKLGKSGNMGGEVLLNCTYICKRTDTSKNQPHKLRQKLKNFF